MEYFEPLLTFAVILSGIICLLDVTFLAKKRTAENAHMPWWVEYSRSFFPILLIVLVIRSFLYEPYRIPSGSLKPTLLVGDFIAVNKFDYGLRLPVSHTKFIKVGEPKVGDIVVFRAVNDPNMDLIKRIVGVPGDKISYINKVLYINGKAMQQTDAAHATDYSEDYSSSWPVLEKHENLTGKPHDIYVRPDINESGDFRDIEVPSGHYFAMGDNRDNSNDSRFWGFVPEENIIGKADMIWFSWDSQNNSIRWHRIGERIN